MISADPQPDQKPELWDDHVSVYENVFEPFTMQFARAAIDALSLARVNVCSTSGPAAAARHWRWPRAGRR